MGGLYGVTKRHAFHLRLLYVRCDTDFVLNCMFPANFDFEYSKRHVTSSNYGSWAVGYLLSSHFMSVK